MNRKWLLGIIFGVSLVFLFVLFYFEFDERYHTLILKEEKWEKIIKNRKENSHILLENIKFNDIRLLIDEEDSTVYYSYVSSSKQFNPVIHYDGIYKIAFLEEITEEKVRNNHSFDVMIYSDKYYRIYHLVVSSLPILNIDYKEDGKVHNIPFQLTLYDNREKAFQRMNLIDGDLTIVSNGTAKDDYQFSLKEESLGRNERDYSISLLGGERHSEYVLNSLVEDRERIRSVFTTNLWEKIDDEKNDLYQYVELFVNHHYVGLYSLGYSFEKNHLRLGENEFLVYKKNFLDEEVFVYERNKRGNRSSDVWEEVEKYQEVLHSGDIESIKEKNSENAMDVFLLYLFSQATDHVREDDFSNTYMRFFKSRNGYQVQYIPWDFRYTFGLSTNGVVASSDNRYLMKENPISLLIELGDENSISLLKKEYQRLRKGVWSDKELNTMLEQYEEDLFSSGAYLRDCMMWEESCAVSLKSFRNYVFERLESLDQYMNSL